MSEPGMIHVEQLERTFRTRHGTVRALADVDLDLPAGSFTCVRGPSGCGKTTLLLTLGAMQRPDRGRVEIDGCDIYALSPRARARFRATQIGFVFQMFHLAPYLNVLENVCLAAPSPRDPEVADLARARLEALGLGDRLHHFPGQLSAGERQRTALARALLNRPAVILADEPTGNLDPDNAREVFACLDRYRRDGGTVLVATHGDAARPFAGRELRLDQGRLRSQGTPSP